MHHGIQHFLIMAVIQIEISGVIRSNKIPVKPDVNYTFSSWGKIEGSGGNNSPAVRVNEFDANTKFMGQTNLIFSNRTHNWTQKKTVFKTRSNTSWIYVYGDMWYGYGTFWFDDVKLYEEGTDKNMILNGGFELGAKQIIDFDIRKLNII